MTQQFYLTATVYADIWSWIFYLTPLCIVCFSKEILLTVKICLSICMRCRHIKHLVVWVNSYLFIYFLIYLIETCGMSMTLVTMKTTRCARSSQKWFWVCSQWKFYDWQWCPVVERADNWCPPMYSYIHMYKYIHVCMFVLKFLLVVVAVYTICIRKTFIVMLHLSITSVWCVYCTYIHMGFIMKSYV